MRYGLIGEHLGHSFSKDIHEQIGEYPYSLQELSPEELEGFINAREFKAINVTIPYKEKVIKYLDEVSDEVLNIGACNTIVNRDGKLCGYNTDYRGMKDMLLKGDINVKDKKVLILGTGGTSRTASSLLTDLGASLVRKASRRQSDDENVISYHDLIDKCRDVQIIINTTPCGMYPNNSFKPLSIDMFPKLEGVADVIYNPLRSRLLLDAQANGLKSIGGLYMLVSQAIHANALFCDHEVYYDKMESIYNNLLTKKENICLIGMPSCGKSTVGKMISARLDRTFYDSDTLIEEKVGMAVDQYIHQKGIESFRQIESEVIADLSKKNGCVISTGGGSILKEENVKCLRQNSRIFFLDRSLQNLTPTADRPLSSDLSALKALFAERYPLYQKVCDERIDADVSYDEMVESILNTIR